MMPKLRNDIHFGLLPLLQAANEYFHWQKYTTEHITPGSEKPQGQDRGDVRARRRTPRFVQVLYRTVNLPTRTSKQHSPQLRLFVIQLILGDKRSVLDADG